ncbi:MAG: glycoside hydrolase [Verrucomicrobiae bacterium]|nr:glycoside hydrolase [Verrucomicrobiae bacterium]
MHSKLLFITAIQLSLWFLLSGATPEETMVFQSGEEGYSNYRIPAVITTREGTLLAFSEGRKENRSDSGDIDMVVKRSEDNGRSWSKLQVVWDDGQNTCGNPCPVVNQRTGRIVMLMTWNRGDDHGRDLHAGTAKGTRRVFQTYSDDDGLSWKQAWEITSDVKDPSWWWYATGPGIGIQLEKGPHKGRLVIPANHTARGYFGAHTLYSDDGGKSWSVSNVIKPTVNESQVVEVSDGRLMMNMRTQGVAETTRPPNGYRSLAYSEDGGATWSDPVFDDELGDPVCQASIIRFDKNHLLFSNPKPPISANRGKRILMTVRASHDDGETWPYQILITEGPSAYSSLVRTPDGQVGLLYEKDKDIVFAKFPISDIN